MGPLGWQETIFIFGLALLIFGPKELPKLGKTIGKAMAEFRRASSELKSTFDREYSSLERETELKEVTNSINNDSYNYDSSSYDSGNYGYESNESTATNPSTASASAPQGAQSTTATPPEGTISSGSVAAAANESPALTATSEAAPVPANGSEPKAVTS